MDKNNWLSFHFLQHKYLEGQGLKISKLILVTHLQGYYKATILETTINIRFMTVTSFVRH